MAERNNPNTQNDRGLEISSDESEIASVYSLGSVTGTSFPAVDSMTPPQLDHGGGAAPVVQQSTIVDPTPPRMTEGTRALFKVVPSPTGVAPVPQLSSGADRPNPSFSSARAASRDERGNAPPSRVARMGTPSSRGGGSGGDDGRGGESSTTKKIAKKSRREKSKNKAPVRGSPTRNRPASRPGRAGSGGSDSTADESRGARAAAPAPPPPPYRDEKSTAPPTRQPAPARVVGGGVKGTSNAPKPDKGGPKSSGLIPRRLLEVEVIEAAGLLGTNNKGSDPKAQLYLVNLAGKQEKSEEMQQSPVINNTVSPVWKYTAVFGRKYNLSQASGGNLPTLRVQVRNRGRQSVACVHRAFCSRTLLKIERRLFCYVSPLCHCCCILFFGVELGHVVSRYASRIDSILIIFHCSCPQIKGGADQEYACPIPELPCANA